MSDDPYTPDEAGARLAYVDGLFASGTRNIKEQREELRAEFDRFVAKIKADALREAANELSRMNTRAGVADPTRDSRRVRAMADRIEEEA